MSTPPWFLSKVNHYPNRNYYVHAQFPESISIWYSCSTIFKYDNGMAEVKDKVQLKCKTVQYGR